MTKNKVCPLLIAATLSKSTIEEFVRLNEEGFTYCLKDHCAWWSNPYEDEAHNCCAILEISNSIYVR